MVLLLGIAVRTHVVAEISPVSSPQPNGPALGSWRQPYEIWQADKSWEQGSVTSLLQTHDGYLWLGTYHGLVRFDGVRVTVFDSGNTGGSLVNGLITSLYEDPSGALWIGHETGQLTRFAEGQFTPIRLPEGQHGVIEAIACDEAADLWVLYDSGKLFRVRDGRPIDVPGGASPTRKVSMARANNGQIWVVANGAVATLQQGNWTPCPLGGADPSIFFERVAPARDGGMWLLGNGQVRKWRQGRWTPGFPIEPATPGAVATFMETRAGELIIGSLREGIYRLFPGGQSDHFGLSEGLSHNWVRSVCEDHEGNIWIGNGAGFDGLRPRKVQMLEAPDRWQGYLVLSFAVEPDGSAWVGTEGAGLYRYEGKQWSRFTVTNGISNPYVWSVLETKARKLYVGTWGGGLMVHKGQQFESPGDLDRITAAVLSLYEGHEGGLWIGTRNGLYKYENDRLTWFAGEDRLVNPDVRSITEAKDGTLWFGMSGGGLGRLQGKRLKQYRRADGLGSDQIECLYADSDGALWIGTADNGLTRFKQERFATINDRQGLPSRIIYHIVDDGAGNFWLGSQAGILRVDKADLNRCADGQSAAVRCLNFAKEEGLASTACTGGFQPGACRDTEGRLWFPTTKGLAVIDPLNVTTNTARPPVQIEEVIVDNVPVAPTQLAAAVERPLNDKHPERLRIKPGGHQFEFQYAALSFRAPGKVRFKYQLEGLDPDWVQAGTRRVAPYSYLPPADYTFRVIACNDDDVWNETGATLAITVLPFFWQTWWFKGAGLAAGAASVGAAVLLVARRRERRKLEQLERQRALERERARIARDIHDDLGASLTRISMLSQSARADLDGQPQAAEDLDQIYQTSRELTRAMDEIVWAVNPKHDTLDSLVTYLGRFAQHFLSSSGVRCRLDVPVKLPSWTVSAEVRHNVFLALKEALNNVVKHAQATEVRIALEIQPGGFALLVGDNGQGFEYGDKTNLVWSTASPGGNVNSTSDTARLSGGNGLLNMRKRLEEIGGRAQWDTAPGEGTRVRLQVTMATNVIKTHDNHISPQ